MKVINKIPGDSWSLWWLRWCPWHGYCGTQGWPQLAQVWPFLILSRPNAATYVSLIAINEPFKPDNRDLVQCQNQCIPIRQDQKQQGRTSVNTGSDQTWRQHSLHYSDSRKGAKGEFGFETGCNWKSQWDLWALADGFTFLALCSRRKGFYLCVFQFYDRPLLTVISIHPILSSSPSTFKWVRA